MAHIFLNLYPMLEYLNFNFGFYDWLLVFMVTALGVFSAYKSAGFDFGSGCGSDHKACRLAVF